MNLIKQGKYFITLLLLQICNLSCNFNSQVGQEFEIHIDGSSTAYPITEAVAEEYRHQFPNVRITIGISGSGGGFKKFVRSETDILMSSREITSSERQSMLLEGKEFLALPIARDAIAIIVHPENRWVDSLSAAELNLIWGASSQDEVTLWSDIRPNWPAKEIHLFGPGTASGTYDNFVKNICPESGTRGDYTASEDDNILVQGIARDKYSLGFFGLPYYIENKNILKVVPIDFGQGAHVASAENILNQSYEPLTRKIYIYITKEKARRKDIFQFTNFFITSSKKLSQEVGYVPLSENLYTQALQDFKSFTEER